MLRAYTERSLVSVDARHWAEAMISRLSEQAVGRFDDDLHRSCLRFGARLAEVVVPLREIRVGETHGDLQGGNVLVADHGRRIAVIDWEYHGRRYEYYDPMVFFLGARRGARLLSELEGFVHLRDRHPAMAFFPKESPMRRRVAAAFLLEDLVWMLEADGRAPFCAPSPAMRVRMSISEMLLRLVEC